MNVLPVPTAPQHHTMFDGSKSINQSEQVQFNMQVSTAMQIGNDNFSQLAGKIIDLQTELKHVAFTHEHFRQFVTNINPELVEQYLTTLIVQSRLEEANAGTNI